MEHFGQNNHPRDYVDFARIIKISFCTKLHCIKEYGEDFQVSSVTIPFFKIYFADGFALIQVAGRRAKCKSFIKSGGKLLIVINSSSTCYRIWSQIKFTDIAILVLFFWSCSFSRTILCRSRCDNCKKTIRFLGVRCQDCRSVKTTQCY